MSLLNINLSVATNKVSLFPEAYLSQADKVLVWQTNKQCIRTVASLYLIHVQYIIHLLPFHLIVKLSLSHTLSLSHSILCPLSKGATLFSLRALIHMYSFK